MHWWSYFAGLFTLPALVVLLAIFQKATGLHHNGRRYRFRWTK